ncbi:alkaline phosphatase family protein [Kiloniella laminariae]|uniref:alkaline phosphatase family protein n=1 Tax=Kiloniella laminariae TaxID=454162 RepID=UPI0003638B1B|nr:alkaline phosphatase family protein [Kiloniella laminariae]
MAKNEIRNILLITADQWRADCLSSAGHLVQTPNLDKLAADGLAFRKHFTQCLPCGPSRTSLLTSMYAMNHRHVQNGTPLDANFTNIAKEARKQGYDPILYGYTDTPADPRGRAESDPDLLTYAGVMPGFRVGSLVSEELAIDWFGQLEREGIRLPENQFDITIGSPDYPGAKARGHAYAPPGYGKENSDTAFIADKLVDFIKVYRQPWFVHGVFLRPHPPLFAPEPYNSMYDPSDVALPHRAETVGKEQRQHPYLEQALEKMAESGNYMGHEYNVRDLPDHEIQQMRAAYYGLISEVDDQLGRVIQTLKDTDQYDNTLIIFTSDHAEQLGDHWLWGKLGYFDESCHIPLIIRDPRKEADASRGQTVESHFTEAVDIMPTVLDLIDGTVPMQCDGHSLRCFLEGEQPEKWRSEVHWEYDFRDLKNFSLEQKFDLTSDQCVMTIIRDDSYKYVHFTALPPLLFDLKKDPEESLDLAKDPEHFEVVLRYAQKMLSWRQNYAARGMSHMQITTQGMINRQYSRI